MTGKSQKTHHLKNLMSMDCLHCNIPSCTKQQKINNHVSTLGNSYNGSGDSTNDISR